MTNTHLTKSSIAPSKPEVNQGHCSQGLGKSRLRNRTRKSSDLLGKEEQTPFLGKLVVLIH